MRGYRISICLLAILVSAVAPGTRHAAAQGLPGSIGFSIGAIWKFRQHMDNPTQIPIGTPISLAYGMSCTVFVGEGTLLGEDTCVWAKFSGHKTNDNSIGTDVGTDVVAWHFGGQAEIAPGWFLSGVAGAGDSSSQDTTGLSSNGRTFDAAVILKRVDGPWFFAAGVGFSTVSQQITRSVAMTGSAMTSSLSSSTGGLRLRVAYDFAFSGWYLRPRADFDLVFTTDSGLRETGPSSDRLALYPGSKTAVGLTPALEVGSRYDVGPGMILRPYVSAGASFLPDSTFSIRGNFAGVPFSGTFDGPNVVANVEAGLQLYQVKGWEMRMDYRLSATDSFRNHALGFRTGWHF